MTLRCLIINLPFSTIKRQQKQSSIKIEGNVLVLGIGNGRVRMRRGACRGRGVERGGGRCRPGGRRGRKRQRSQGPNVFDEIRATI